MKSYQKTKQIRLKGKKLTDLFKYVVERDVVCQNPFCEAGWPLDAPHHVKKRSQGGEDKPENLTLPCVVCHRLIHDEWVKVEGYAPDNLVWFDKRK
jgi:hypothetical protein